MTPPRRTRPQLAAIPAAFLLLLASCGKEPRTPRARRVILITCDTLRADRLSCYGYSLPTTPNIDAFAEEATLYENAWSCSSLTGPALSTLLSGQLPDQIGVSRGNPMLMDPSIETFPEVLADDGVATAAVVSNWMLHRPPGELAGWGVSQGFEHYDDEMVTKELNRDFPERTAGDTTDAAIAWLETVPGVKDGAKEGSKDGAEDRSFFLWVHYQDPHGPYAPRDELIEKFLPPGKDGEAPLPTGTSNRGIDRIPAYQVIGEERRPSVYKARYDAEVRTFDEAFGRLIGWIRQNGLLDDALVVLTADHGESLGEHGRWFCHGENLHVEETRVPFIVRLPNVVPGDASANVSGTAAGGAPANLRRGERTKELVSHLDIYPTVLAAFGFPPRPSLGESLFAPVSNARVVPQTLYEPDSPRRWAVMTTEEYRLIFDGQDFKLFHLPHDPGELQDIKDKAPDRVREIFARGRKLMGPNPTATTPAFQRSDEDMKKALKSLGYVEGTEEH